MGELTDEMRSFLGERRYAVLATHDPDGSIRLAPIWFLFEDDRFHFATPPEAERCRTSSGTSRPRSWSTHAQPGRERWVSASGLLEILRDGEAQSINARIWRRYLAPEALGGPIEAALRASDDVTLRLTPTAWQSWTAPIVDSPERSFLAVDA